MSEVLVVCGAGASSTFLVHALRKQANSRELDYLFTPASIDALETELQPREVILISSHIAHHFDRVDGAARAAGAAAIQLPPLEYTAEGADIALDLLESHRSNRTESRNHG